MPPTDPLQPLPGESALSVEVGLIVFALGALVFLYVAIKLVREWRAGRESDP
ncbi:MAG: hypothetical protein ACLFVJ_03465 [Persicimonas sp.]